MWKMIATACWRYSVIQLLQLSFKNCQKPHVSCHTSTWNTGCWPATLDYVVCVTGKPQGAGAEWVVASATAAYGGGQLQPLWRRRWSEFSWNECVCVCVTDSAMVSDWFAALWQFLFFFFPLCFVFQSQVQANLNQSNASGDALESVLTDFDWGFFSLLFLCLRILALLFFSSSLPSPSNPFYRSWEGWAQYLNHFVSSGLCSGVFFLTTWPLCSQIWCDGVALWARALHRKEIKACMHGWVSTLPWR